MLFQLQMRYNSLVHDPLGQQDQPGQPTNETFDRRKCDSRHNQVFSSFFFSSYLAGYEMRVNLRGAPQAHLRIMHCYLCSYRCTPDHLCPQTRNWTRAWQGVSTRARARFLALHHHHRLIYSFMTAAAHVGVPLLLSYNNNKNNNAIHKPRKKQSQKKCAIRLPIVDL